MNRRLIICMTCGQQFFVEQKPIKCNDCIGDNFHEILSKKIFI